MKSIIKNLLPKRVIIIIINIRKQIRNFYGLATVYGQWQTIRNWECIDSGRNPIPWYTYPAIEFLAHLDMSRFSIFEYGSGNSTLYWATRAKHVTSVEDDENWYSKIKNDIKNLKLRNVSYFLEKEPMKYWTMAEENHDIIIVDGKYRRDCIEHLYKIGWQGVMLILDNSDWYPSSVLFIRENLQWVQVDFHGFGPINDYSWTTTIFINPNRYREIAYFTNLKSQCALPHITESGEYDNEKVFASSS